MNDLSKAIELLEGLKSSLEGKHRAYEKSLGYAGVDLSEEIGETEEAMQLLQDSLQRIQRLQTLQAEDVTPEELQAVNGEVPESVFIGSPIIAAVCRGMLREVGERSGVSD